MKRTTRQWVEDKLRLMAERHKTAVDVPLPRPEKPKRPRYVLSELEAEAAPAPVGPPAKAPAGIAQWEWDEARANVLAGSAPSMIAVGSDIPSDMTMRLNGLTPIAISRKG